MNETHQAVQDILLRTRAKHARRSVNSILQEWYAGLLRTFETQTQEFLERLERRSSGPQSASIAALRAE